MLLKEEIMKIGTKIVALENVTLPTFQHNDLI